MTRLEVPTVNFSKLDEISERQKLDLACREFGFFALKEHGISRQLQTDLSEAMASYFARPESCKQQQERTEANPFGFYNQELTKNRLDQKEIFDISLTETTLWPDDPAFVETTSEWFRVCHEVSLGLLSAIFKNLGKAPDPDPFHDHTSFLRLNYYPQYTARSKDEFGVSHHTDAGALTLLLQEQVASLQFFWGDAWHTVPASEHHLLVNLGDMLQVWSNDTYIAPLHRVLTNAHSDRYSAPYFLNPAYATNVKPLTDDARYRTINWQEFRSGRAAGDYADLGTEIQISDYRL